MSKRPSIEITNLDPVEEARFWSFVKIDWRPDACWEWTGKQIDSGYGRFTWGKHRISANRISFAIFNGNTPKKCMICHTCDNPLCVRPDHLFLGDAKINAADMVKKKRHAHGSRTGTSILTEELVQKIKKSRGIIPYRELADMYGVHKSTITKIMTGKNWAHIP